MRGFFEVGWGISMNAVVSEEGDLVLDPEWDREPVIEDGGDVVQLLHPHQDPGHAVLNAWKPF